MITINHRAKTTLITSKKAVAQALGVEVSKLESYEAYDEFEGETVYILEISRKSFSQYMSEQEEGIK